ATKPTTTGTDTAPPAIRETTRHGPGPSPLSLLMGPPRSAVPILLLAPLMSSNFPVSWVGSRGTARNRPAPGAWCGGVWLDDDGTKQYPCAIPFACLRHCHRRSLQRSPA